MSVPVNINGVDTLNLNLAGTVAASLSSPGTIEIDQTLTASQVTNALDLSDTGTQTLDGSLTIDGTLALGGGPTWTSGAGAPSGTAPTGSLYSNTSGTTGSTLYVFTAGAWTAIA